MASKIRHSGQKIARSKKSDSAHTIDIETVREYTDTLYGRPDEVDLEIVDRIPQVAHDIDELPTPDEIARAVHKVKSRRVRTDILQKLGKHSISTKNAKESAPP